MRAPLTSWPCHTSVPQLSRLPHSMITHRQHAQTHIKAEKRQALVRGKKYQRGICPHINFHTHRTVIPRTPPAVIPLTYVTMARRLPWPGGVGEQKVGELIWENHTETAWRNRENIKVSAPKGGTFWSTWQWTIIKPFFCKFSSPPKWNKLQWNEKTPPKKKPTAVFFCFIEVINNHEALSNTCGPEEVLLLRSGALGLWKVTMATVCLLWPRWVQTVRKTLKMKGGHGEKEKRWRGVWMGRVAGWRRVAPVSAVFPAPTTSWSELSWRFLPLTRGGIPPRDTAAILDEKCWQVDFKISGHVEIWQKTNRGREGKG